MRVKLHQISLSRSDGAEEDDFKTWAHVQLVTRGAANSALWYGSLDGLKQNLAFTSSANGFIKAQYNYNRGSKPALLDNQLICDLYESRLDVSAEVATCDLAKLIVVQQSSAARHCQMALSARYIILHIYADNSIPWL